jgi:hypothetical protein
MKRLAIALSLVFFGKFTIGNLLVYYFSLLISVMYVFNNKPFNSTSLNRTEVVYDVFILINLYFVLLYSDIIEDIATVR